MEIRKKELCLDGLKGVGACIVAFVWHYQHFSPQSGLPFYNIFPISYSYGWLMVELFFALSGFGMMLGYGDKILHRQISFKNYFFKRIAKLYPTFFLTLIVTTCVEFIYRSKVGETFIYPNFDVYHFVLNLFCIQDGVLGIEWSFNSPSWCISIVLICYVMFYAIVYKAKRKSTVYYSLIVIVFVGAIILTTGINYPILNNLVARGISCFSIGAILAGIYEKRERVNSKLLGYVFLLALVTLYGVMRLNGDAAIGNVQMTFIIAIAPMLILSVLFVPWLSKILQWTPLAFLGTLSIDIYLWHFPVQCTIKIIDIYCGLNLNYSSKKIWLSYVSTVLIVCLIYDKCIKPSYEKMIKRIVSHCFRHPKQIEQV